MDWIKRNVAFVVGLAVTVVLLAGAVVFTLQAKSGADAVNAELEAKKSAVRFLGPQRSLSQEGER